MANEETHRFEIHELVDLLKQSTSMIWTGYGAFFTVNTLLATGYGFLLGYEADLPLYFSVVLEFLISFCGIFMSFCAYRVIIIIQNIQTKILVRGAELDRELGTRVFEMIPKSVQDYPFGTVIGSILFAMIWLVGGGYALSRLL